MTQPLGRRIMITGASTALGTRLIETLLGDPTVESILAVGSNFDHPVPDAGERLVYERVDLTRTRSIHTLIFGRARDMQIDSIIDVALHAQARGRRLHALHVDATREILGMCERHPSVRRFVFRSHVEAYDLRAELPTVLTEEHPIDLSGHGPQWMRDRIEADVMVCGRMGMSKLSIAVLRCAECLEAGVGSQLHALLGSPLRLRPLGFDPMLNLVSIADLVQALRLAVRSDASGVFNIPGRDTLPLSEIFEKRDRDALALPSPMLGPAYSLYGLLAGNRQFDYRGNRRRFHLGGVLDGRRARERLGYTPQHALEWNDSTSE